jgi:hypothetical protein
MRICEKFGVILPVEFDLNVFGLEILCDLRKQV